MSKKIINGLQKLLFLVVFILFGFSLTVQAAGEAVKITGQPTDVLVSDGATASTTVRATGEGLKYQWYYTSNGNTSTYYKSSITGATYSAVMNSSREGRKIYCVVTDKYGNKVKSNTVILGIKGSQNVARISRQPANMIVKSGDTASASVQATGLGLKYQWYYTLNGQDNTFYKSSTTKATYSTVMNAERAGRKIYCVVTDVYGNKVKSQTVTLGMNSGKTLAIIQQPTTMNYVQAGETVKVGIKATGDGLKYQWYYTLNGKDGTFYKSSNTTDTYSTIMNEERDGRRIYCLVTDQYGNSVGSIIVALNLLKPLTVAVDPKLLKVNPYDITTLTATVSGGVPPYTYGWYEYNEPYGSFYDFIYEGRDNCQGTTTNVLTKQWGKSISFYEEKAIFCQIQDAAGNKVKSNFVYIGDPRPLQFEEQSGGVIAEVGETFLFEVKVIGGVKKYNYQWQYTKAGMNGYQNIGEGDTWAQGYNQEELLVTVDNTIYNGDYAFRCVVTDRESTTIYSNPAQVKRPPLMVVRNPNGRTAEWGEEVVLTVKAEGGKEPYRYIWECAHQGENDFMTVGDNSATLKIGAGHIYGGETNEEFRCIVIDAEGTRVISGNALIRIRKY